MTLRPPGRSPAALPVVLIAVVTAMALAGCRDSTAQGPATVAAPTVTVTATATRTATAAPVPGSTKTGKTAGAGARCRLGALRTTYAPDPDGGTAGRLYGHLTFTNTSSSTCSLTGFPGVSHVGGGNGTQVGAAADRIDEKKRLVTLAPGQRTRAALSISSSGPYGDECDEKEVDGLRVYPPGSTGAAFVRHEGTGCRNPKVHLLQVSPVGT